MGKQQQLLFDFDVEERAPIETKAPSFAAGRMPEMSVASQPAVEQPQRRVDEKLILKWDFRTTFPEPREDAIEAGKLHDTDVLPANNKSLHEEYERVMLSILSDLDLLAEAQRHGIDPSTGKPPRTEKRRIAVEERLAKEPGRLKHAFEVMLDSYAEGFGDEGAEAFQKAVKARHHGVEVLSDSTVSMQLATQERDEPAPDTEHQYEPGHPWHYYKEGDHAEPLPLDAIAPAEHTLEQLGIKLPKQTEKRRTKLATMLADAARQVELDERRYQELVDRGVDALSDYDRNIAYGGNDELARASSIALCHNHVRYSRGRVKLLGSLLNQPLLTGIAEN